MSIRKVFEKQIKEYPYDTETRHIFADWLDENTDEAELAGFYRKSTLLTVGAGEAFLREFCKEVKGDFDDLIETIYKHLDNKCHYVFAGEDDSCGFAAEEMLDDNKYALQFWQAWSDYTGRYHMPETECDGDGNPFLCCG